MSDKDHSGGKMAQDSTEIEGVRIIGAKSATDDSTNDHDTKSVVMPSTKSGNIELPHWSEAPTGEVQIVKDTRSNNDNDKDYKDGWEALTGSQPRIRVDSAHWKESDYEPGLSLNDDSLNVGALGNDHISFNESDDEFNKNVAQKRAMPTGSIMDIGSTPVVKKISTVPDMAKVQNETSIDRSPEPELELEKKEIVTERKARSPRKSRSDYKGEKKAIKNDEETKDEIKSEISALIQRTISALALAFLAGICMYLGRIPTLILVTLLIGYMSVELSNAFRAIGSKPAVILVAVMSMFSVIAGYLVGDSAIAISSTVFIMFAGAWYLLGVQKARPVIGMAISSLVFVYVGILGSFAGMILALKDSTGKSIGVSVLFSVILLVAANDTTAYLAGKYFGRTPIAPKISPNKTMEGTTAGIVAALLVSVFIVSGLNDLFQGVPSAVLLGFVAAAFAFIGDLVESMLKRDCKIKDFGTIMPGHGGLMDRFDGLLFAMPIVYFLAVALS